ncbi:hypothetical protein B0A52_05804 [Exophiala mesophila]|uniref:Uncharacterized protein n=1 Tax=Exophiala mesophila TaxID=212818 RepID=A0A438N2K5_EXOME|nr:hypothetical protein B0A52_05804 [Exophiala mesophila]
MSALLDGLRRSVAVQSIDSGVCVRINCNPWNIVLMFVDSVRTPSLPTVSRQSFGSIASSNSNLDNTGGFNSGGSSHNDFALQRMLQEPRLDGVWLSGQNVAERRRHHYAKMNSMMQDISESFQTNRQ